MKKLKFNPFTYFNPYLDPPKQATPDQVADYYFFMVAIDYRTSTTQGHFEGTLNGNFFHGADLMYALAIQKWKESPEYFTAQSMQHISDEEVGNWLSIINEGKKMVIYNPQERAELLRDSGEALKKRGYTSSMELVHQSEGYLIRDNSKGLLQVLKNFKAYSDPVSKKSFLWIKFLSGRGLFHIQDPDNLNVPVDNHLIRIALRTGIIKIQNEEIKTRLREEDPFKLSEDIELREIVRFAFKKILQSKNISFGGLDDLLWVLGRTHCVHSRNPLCHNYEHNPSCQLLIELKIDCRHECPLAQACRGYRDPAFRELFEPTTIYPYFSAAVCSSFTGILPRAPGSKQ